MSCMGGWCPVRESCAMYHADGVPSHRNLCLRGDEVAHPMEVKAPDRVADRFGVEWARNRRAVAAAIAARLTYEDMEQALDMPRNTVEWHASRIRRTLGAQPQMLVRAIAERVPEPDPEDAMVIRAFCKPEQVAA